MPKYCIEVGCKRHAVYSFKGESPSFCKNHKAEMMINVKSKICIEEECIKVASFNFEGNKRPIYCKTHSKSEMIDVKKKKCREIGCIKSPVFNYKGKNSPIYCRLHAKEGMRDVKSRRCKTDMCDILVTYSYEGYCLQCYIRMYPNKYVCKRNKVKEGAVVCYVKENTDFKWVEDRRIFNGYYLHRPDLLLDLGNKVIIVECDENQHNGYDNNREEKRLMEIHKDIGERPIVFIRFNPDGYTKGGKRIVSCWKRSNLGITLKKKEEWDERLGVLKKTIDYWTNPEHVSNKNIEVVNLFFNE